MRSRTLRRILCAVLPLLLAAVIPLWTACGREHKEKDAANAPRAPSPLVGSESVIGLAALHDTVRARALRGDTPGLLRVLVDDSGYRAHVWPTAASYEPDREEVWNFVLGMHKANSFKGMRRLMSDIRVSAHGEVEFPAFQAVEVPGGLLYYASKKEREGGRDRDRGIRLFGSALCLGNSCRVVSYNQGGAKGGSSKNEPETANP